MLSNAKDANMELQMARLFRSFELNDEWCEFRFYEKSIVKNLPGLIAGFAKNQFLPYYFSKPPKWRLKLRKLAGQKRVLPDYIMTGPAKSGSSDLVTHLLLHSNVMTPLAKDFRFRTEEELRLYYPTEKEKQALEAKSDHPVRCGFLAPRLHLLGEMDELYKVNPDAKVIITLRDPASRTYSSWKYELLLEGKNVKHKPHFKDYNVYVDRILEQYPDFTRGEVPVLHNSIYHEQVAAWIERFGRDNVLILDVADYFSERQPTLEKIQAFLDLPIENIPEYGKRTNENPVKMPKPEQEALDKLSAFYKPYNEKLFDLIGQEFNWK